MAEAGPVDIRRDSAETLHRKCPTRGSAAVPLHDGGHAPRTVFACAGPTLFGKVEWILLCLPGRHVQAGAVFGLVVHWRIYPVIYALPVLLFLSGQRQNSDGEPSGGAGVAAAQRRERAQSLLWRVLACVSWCACTQSPGHGLHSTAVPSLSDV